MLDVTSFLLLAAPPQPGALLLLGVIVVLVIGFSCVGYFALAGSADKAHQITRQSAEFDFKNDNTGPIRRYPATGGGYLPAEISSLGEPEYLHRYESFAEQCHLGWLFGSSADKYPTYISYDTALVVVRPDSYTVIPWEEITEFLHNTGFKASNGQKFAIDNNFTNYGEIYVRFESEILANQLPRALEAIAAGEEWLFAPFTDANAGTRALSFLGQPQLTSPLAISKQGIRYKSTALAWSDVGSIHVTRHLINGAHCRTTLSVRKNWDIFGTLEFDFQSVANSFLLTELLPYVCPAHLLVPAGSQGAN